MGREDVFSGCMKVGDADVAYSKTGEEHLLSSRVSENDRPWYEDFSCKYIGLKRETCLKIELVLFASFLSNVYDLASLMHFHRMDVTFAPTVSCTHKRDDEVL